MSNLMTAKLVWDGGDEVRIPEEMGVPRADQMQGTAAERLSELAGRVCYDSLGKGRPSFGRESVARVTGSEPLWIEGYHDHILSVGHGSVLEHFNFTVEIPLVERNCAHFAWLCVNRPGLVLLIGRDRPAVRITVNLRTVLEWNYITPISEHAWSCAYSQENDRLHWTIRMLANRIAPHIVPLDPYDEGKDFGIGERIVEPSDDREKWISLYLSGSRGFSHEQVRHGDFTAISQRSTRYVDESKSPLVMHPLLAMYLGDCDSQPDGSPEDLLTDEICHTSASSSYLYGMIVERLEPWLISRGVDKTSARKQARGAARGYLGNALHTEMIFSASVSQWKRMIRQRCSPAADAEIREIYTHVVRELKSSRYGDSFAAFELEPSPDGIGMIAVEHAKVTPAY